MAINHHIQSELLAPLRVGVMGRSVQSLDEDQARKYLLEAFNPIKAKEGRNVEIVSGWLWLGIPGVAYEIATAFGWNTVGVACAKAKDYECFPCDRVIIVGDEWGDESEYFLNSIDLLIKVDCCLKRGPSPSTPQDPQQGLYQKLESIDNILLQWTEA